MARNVFGRMCIQNVKAASMVFSELWMTIRVCISGLPTREIGKWKKAWKLIRKIEHLPGNRTFARLRTRRELRNSSGTHFSAVLFVAFFGPPGTILLMNALPNFFLDKLPPH